MNGYAFAVWVCYAAVLMHAISIMQRGRHNVIFASLQLDLPFRRSAMS